MPIPDFGAHGALPPFTDSAVHQNARSPYSATMHELVERFCTSIHRAQLLKGLNEYRKHLYSGGFVNGFQWIDGSFVENVEATRRRNPKDIDIVTLFNRPIRYQIEPQKWFSDYENHLFQSFFDTDNMKPRFQCDTYAIDLDAGQRSLVRGTVYWYGLFSDMRDSAEKKGIVEIPLAADPMEFTAIDQAIGVKAGV